MAEVVHAQHFPIFTLIYNTKVLLTSAMRFRLFVTNKQLRKTTRKRFLLEAFLYGIHGNTAQKLGDFFIEAVSYRCLIPQ
jgi:hypothetical protein